MIPIKAIRSNDSDTKPDYKKVLAKRHIETLGKTISGICILIVVLLVVTLIFMIAKSGIHTFFQDANPDMPGVQRISLWSFLTGTTWQPGYLDEAGVPIAGALPMIAGSFAVTVLSTLIAAPLAIGAAVYVVEISPQFGRKYFRPAIELLVGIPSVVYGLIGLSIIVAWTRSWSGTTGYGVFAGTIVLSLMILPTITSLSIDALSAVPSSYRQGGLALGSTRWQVIHKIILRAALPSLLTAVILGMTRAFGEALAVQMVIGNAAQMPSSLFTPASTLTSILTMGMGEATGLQQDILWSLALLLLIVSLLFILIIHFIARKGSLETTR